MFSMNSSKAALILNVQKCTAEGPLLIHREHLEMLTQVTTQLNLNPKLSSQQPQEEQQLNNMHIMKPILRSLRHYVVVKIFANALPTRSFLYLSEKY